MPTLELKDHIGGVEISDDVSESSASISQDSKVQRRQIKRMNTQEQIEYEQERMEEISRYSDDYDSGDEFSVPLEDGRNEVKDVIRDISKRSIKFTHTASAFRYLNYLSSAIVIIGTFLIGTFLALDDYENKYVIWGSFGISVIKGVYDLLNLGQRGVRYFDAGYQLREKLRTARNALFMMRSGDDLYSFAQHLREEIDGIEFRLIRSMYGPEDVRIDNNNEVCVDHGKDQ